jgi:5-methylcytosine-specific restriction protein A
MNTFIFIWDPEQWFWGPSEKDPEQKTFEENLQEIQKSGVTSGKWRCKHYIMIQPGDIAFLAIIGKDKKGIFGSGFIGEPKIYDGPHWRDKSSKIIHYANLQFTHLLNPFHEGILTSSTLKNRLPEYKTPRASGESIRPKIGIELSRIWTEFITNTTDFLVAEESGAYETFSEGTPTQITQTRYERNKDARLKCIKHYGGPTCIVCNFNFEKKYGIVGKDFIHVHHLTQISEPGKEHRIDPVNGLVPVCPNCHSIIHKRKVPYTIEEVKQFVLLQAPEFSS